MNIIIVGPNPKMSYRDGGVAKFVEYQSYLEQHEEIDIAFNYLDWDSLNAIKLPIFAKKTIGIFITFLKLLFIRSDKFTVVHIHASLYNKGAIKHLLLLGACSVKGIPSFLQIHGGRLSKLNKISHTIWSIVFYLSEKIALFPGPQYSEFEADGYKEKLVRIANFIPTKCLYPIQKDYAFPKLLFLGRVVKEKGVFQLIQSFLQLKKEGIEAELTIAGSGNDLNALKGQVVDSNYKHDIRFTGFVSGEELETLIDDCNIFVLPSWHEGFPLSFLECTLYGMSPVITTNNAIPYYFKSGDHYLPINLEEDGNLLNQLKKIVTDVNLRKKMGGKVQEVVKNKFTVEAYIPELIHIYETVFYSGVKQE